MARLPVPGSDQGSWGTILNEYLSTTLAADGSLKPNTVVDANILGGINGAKLTNNSVEEIKLSSDVRTKLNAVGGNAVTSVATKTGDVVLDKNDVGLSNVDNTADAAKPVSSATQTAINNGLATKINTSQIGAANGVASLDGNTRVPDAQLPTRLSVEELNNAYGSGLSVSKGIIVADPAVYAGIDPTGATNSKTGLQNAVSAAIDVGAKVIIPKGTYLISSGASIRNVGSDGSTRGSLSIDWSAATIISTLGVAPFEMLPPIPTIENVSGVTITSVTTENGLAQPAIQLSIGSSPTGWKRGDIIKVFSDDIIPFSEPGTGGNQPRTGAYFVLHSIVGSTVTVMGTIIDPMTTNIRLTRMNPDIKIDMKGGRLEFDQTLVTAGAARNGVILRSLVGPRIDGITINNATGPAIVVNGCYGAIINDASIEYGLDDSDDNLSYGILDNASAFTVVTRPRGRNLRHLYTDDASELPAGSAGSHAYGRTWFATVTAGTCQGSTSAAFDTHHASYGVQFVDCIAIESFFGFQLRGRQGKIVNARAVNCNRGGRIFTQSVGGDTFDSAIYGWESIDCDRDLLINIHPTGHPNAGVRQATPVHVRGFRTKGTKYRALEVLNATVYLTDFHFEAGTTMTTAGAAIRSTNSRMILSGEITYDFTFNTAGTGLFAIDLGTGAASVFEANTSRYRHGSNHANVTLVNATTSDNVRVDEIKCTQATTPIFTGPGVSGSYIDWSAENNTRSSAGVLVSSSGASDATALATISRTRKASVTLLVDLSGGAATLGTLPAAQFDGQTLRIINHGTANSLTITHDPSTGGRRSLAGGSSKTVAPGESITLASAIPSGVWKQVSAVI